MAETTTELRARIRRLQSVRTIAQGNTRALDCEIAAARRELTRRDLLIAAEARRARGVA